MKLSGQVLAIIFAFMLIAASASAQAPPPVPEVGAPIDALSLVLLAVGAGYGAFRTKSRKD
jgi:hypothetical protein